MSKGDSLMEEVIEANKDPRPRRYEVRDAETGEKLSGVSFILTPTGEEMHLLTEPGKYAGPMKDIGVYYHGELHGGMSGANSLPAIRPIALEYMVERIIKQLASLGPGRKHYGHMKQIKRIGEYAAGKWEKFCEENAELVAEEERKEKELLECVRSKVRGQTENG